MYEKAWTTQELQEEFRVLQFTHGVVIVRRKADGVLGSLQFTHAPRTYFGWLEHVA